jgi:hypothetical protein
MPDLFAALQKHDLGYLRILAGFWGLELESRVTDAAVEELCAAILDVDLVRETVEILPAESRSALNTLIASNGKLEWPFFARKHGDIREMGEAKRDRERPHLKPISPAETLFYRGLLQKDFFGTDKGALEFAYVPDDLLEILQSEVQPVEGKAQEPLGRAATPVEKAFEILANDHLLDDATTYLAALRIGLDTPATQAARPADLQQLLVAAKILNKKGEPQAEAVKKFLEAARGAALNALYNSWLESQTFDELRLIPSIQCEGEWLRQNQPQVTREFLMNLIHDLPQDKWWSLPAFLRDLKLKFPDFQRPAGDYDSWFIKRAVDGQYLRGFAYWDQVDGALVKYFIQMLHWLGKADLAAPEEGKEFTAFRISSKVKSQKSSDLRPSTFDSKLAIASNGKITVPRIFSRAVRYQIARFCEWDNGSDDAAGFDTRRSTPRYSTSGDEYKYHVTARSLKQATQQGLKAEQLLSLLVKYTKGSVPPALVKALKQWDARGVAARVETHPVLRVASPETVDALRKSKAGKFLGEALSPTAVIIKSGAEAKIIEALTELGILAEFEN